MPSAKTKPKPKRPRARSAKTGPITILVPYIKGGGTDKRTRLLARFLGRELKQPVRVLNRPGAVAGHEAIAAAAPDGLTLGMITGEIGMMHWHKGVTELTWKSYTPLAVPYVEAAAIIVRHDAPYKNLAEFLAAARTSPIRGSGSPDFGVWKFALMGLLGRMGIGTKKISWTPTVSGEEGIANVIAGKADVAPVPMVEAPELIFAGKIRPLVTMDSQRHPLFPDVPTTKQAVGVDWSVAHWRGLVAPARLPAAIKARLIAALRRVERDRGFTAACRKRGYTLGWHIDRGFARYMKEDDAQFGRIIRAGVAPAREIEMGRLGGKVAIVTGAAHGNRAAIGAVYAKALAREGAKVTVADMKDCASVVAEIAAAGGTAQALTVDVRDAASTEALVARTVEKFGRLDILINNAGLGSNIPPISITELSVADWDEVMAVNVRGPFLCAKAAIPAMKKNGYGKIVNVGSSTMLSALPHRLHYVTSKGAILAMTRAMAKELGPDGIRVNTIAYSLVSNAVTDAEFKAQPEKRKAILGARSIAKDIFPADLVGTLVYLASPDSDAMTGQMVNIDGGQNFT